jgi:CheY-like chemotaxis protein
MQIRMEVCDLYGLFGELLTFFTEQQKHMGKQHLFFNLQAPKNLVIITDKVKLKQIFINLISNAFKYTNEGKIEGGCKFDSNHNLIFYVSDTGIGIPPDKQKLVFERFTQLSEDKKNKIGGTGLGLAIVKGLANLLGAEILLESEPGKGSTFSFIIPHKTIKTVHQESLKTEEQTKLYFSNKNILVVEDDRYNAEYLKEILSDHGLNILYAANGQEAIQKALDQPIDLVLMDVRLPDIDGYEATRQIRLHKPNLEIIAQTAFASPDEKQKALDAGCNDYISKPTAKDLLLSMISKHLEKK